LERLHDTPHAPQFVSVVRLVSQPSELEPLQSPKPAEQAATPQTPPTQFGVPLAAEHTWLQLPQLLMLVDVLVSHPLFGFPSQLPKPDEQLGTHAPALQATVPFAFVHAAPHAPQFNAVVRLVSQPFLELPSQSPKPAAQAGTHAPATQLVVPFVFVHVVPHVPQFVAVVCVFVSHPLFGSPSQFANPAVHDGKHVPDAHAFVPCWFVHAVPQAPQFAFVSKGASQPLAALPSQFPKPDRHVMPQAPAVQLGVPLLLLQTLPQAPQLDVLVSVLTSQPFEPSPSQLPNPALQALSVQAPDVHEAEAFESAQATPQAPQLPSVVRLDSQPLPVRPSQLPKPAVHAWSAQTPLKHVADAFEKLQALPQSPQFPMLVFRLVSHPVVARPSQSPKPGSHAIWHAPPEQLGEPLVALQVRPQVPQLFGSVAVEISHPVWYERSQLANPALQP
jgi:hypothetical protein